MRPLAAPSLLALAASLTAAAAAPVTFASDGSNFHTFVVPETGTYDILAFGAQGGAGENTGGFLGNGGLGAEVGGNFVLTAGETLSIAVGIMGGSALRFGDGGGGGGSFVVGPSGMPLVIAGGGGGGSASPGERFANPASGEGGQTATSGGSSSGGTGGTAGSGGGGGTLAGGGGGGGFLSAGGSGISPGFGDSATGGGGYPGLLGGAGIRIMVKGDLIVGGFGGGGGGGAGFGGGGGGGYSGGGGGGYSDFGGHLDYLSLTSHNGGGGGGSFDGGTDQVLMGGFNSGDGSVVITELSATAVPEPASLALLGTGFGGLLAVRRRRAG